MKPKYFVLPLYPNKNCCKTSSYIKCIHVSHTVSQMGPIIYWASLADPFEAHTSVFGDAALVRWTLMCFKANSVSNHKTTTVMRMAGGAQSGVKFQAETSGVKFRGQSFLVA